MRQSREHRSAVRVALSVALLMVAGCGSEALEPEEISTVDSSLLCGQLAPGKVLRPGDTVESCGGRTLLAMQGDGNLVAYFNPSKTPLWATSTYEGGSSVVMQGDGNLVIYNTQGQALWSSVTHGNGGARLAVQDDGNIVIYSVDNRPLWATMSMPAHAACGLDAAQSLRPGQSVQSCNKAFTLVMQGDGNLVVYGQQGNAVWASATHADEGSPKRGAFTVMQADGNLVVYNAQGQPLWHTGTHGNLLAAMSLEDDGTLKIIGREGQVFWSSDGYRGQLPTKVVGGYWQNWGMPSVTLRNVPSAYNVVFLAFALGVNQSSGEVRWSQSVQSDASFREDVRLLQSQGRKVILSIGGWFDLPKQSWGFRLGPDNTAGRVSQFVASVKALRASYGFDGIDWDLEHGIHVPGVVAASRQLKAELGPNFIVTAAPPPSDDNYRSVALELGKDIDFIAPMYYDQNLDEGAARAQIISKTASLINAGIPAHKVGIGTRSVSSSGSLSDTRDVTTLATINSAWNELEARYPGLRGAYAWSLNLDQTVGYAFANQVGSNVRAP